MQRTDLVEQTHLCDQVYAGWCAMRIEIQHDIRGGLTHLKLHICTKAAVNDKAVRTAWDVDMSSFRRTSFLHAFFRHSGLGHGPWSINGETVPEVGDIEVLL